MADGRYRFDEYTLDATDRQLRRGDAPVELNARYLDALALLVREQGRLVSKERFLDEVWRGIPVTDEALTQCIRTLRRLLGDDAARPRYIATVPKHGYRFIGDVRLDGAPDAGDDAPPAPAVARATHVPTAPGRLQGVLLLGGAGTLGAGVAGVVGGLCFGFAGASHPPQPGTGAASVLLVLLCLTVVAALLGGAGVAFGVAACMRPDQRPDGWTVVGGALGGLLVGAVVKLLGLDAFSLIVGRSPGDITGGFEGLMLGGAVGVGAWLGQRRTQASLRRVIATAALAGGVAGLAIPLLGGRLMGGSLDLLAHALPASRLRLDAVGRAFGEPGFGPISQAITGMVEGALFAGCIVGAMALARHRLDPQR